VFEVELIKRKILTVQSNLFGPEGQLLKTFFVAFNTVVY